MKESFVRYQDLINVSEVNNRTMNQKFVKIPMSSKKVIGRYVTDLNELEYSPIIRVRKRVLDRLRMADTLLKEKNPNYQLMVVYGYRAMEKQVKYFNEELKKYEKDFKDKLELYEFVHEKIAVPEVSGHPTGGAVDVVIYDMQKEEIIDFGTKVHDFDNFKSYIYYSKIKSFEHNNRILLDLHHMMASGGTSHMVIKNGHITIIRKNIYILRLIVRMCMRLFNSLYMVVLVKWLTR